ncbi:MAG: alcohol dehydrogenase catalytic domain-containing protein [Bryobacteraceae bacterium]|nr:alcohol dehydrogenase catalytic domain-containing protein [Bryobacteraceae bacterium]
MLAAVYTGQQQVEVREVPTPEIGPGELLVRVEACGICHTDLKKIEYDLLAGPRIYGHETAGVVAGVGAGVTRFALGDRVVAFHHIPCSQCFYCQRKLYAQCPVYKRVGITAGYEPAGGGFAQYIRIMDWIVARGVEKIPDGVSYAAASLVEPLNTCLKAVVQAAPQPGDTVIVMGQGPIGLKFTMLLKDAGAHVIASDLSAHRRALAASLGAGDAVDPRHTDLATLARDRSHGRGADLVFVAVSAPKIVEQAVRATRPGARIVLFAQTSEKERIELAGADICKDERMLCGSYSADVDLQAESANLIFSGRLPVERLISHRVPLAGFRDGMELALHPDEQSLKILIEPQQGIA